MLSVSMYYSSVCTADMGGGTYHRASFPKQIVSDRIRMKGSSAVTLYRFTGKFYRGFGTRRRVNHFEQHYSSFDLDL